jgi:hypothetical protein
MFNNPPSISITPVSCVHSFYFSAIPQDGKGFQREGTFPNRAAERNGSLIKPSAVASVRLKQLPHDAFQIERQSFRSGNAL